MKKILEIFSLTFLLALTHFAFAKDQAPIVKPDPQKALIYVMRPASFSKFNKTWVFVDDQFICTTKGATYCSTNVTPGTHLFWTSSMNVSSMYLNVVAGKTYFFKQGIGLGWLKADAKLLKADEEQGNKWLKELKYMSPKSSDIAKGKEMAIDLLPNAKHNAK